jgi:hypothetical protein
MSALHTWISAKDARLFTTAAIAIAGCPGRSPVIEAFADACLGFGERFVGLDKTSLGQPLLLMPCYDADRHWSYWSAKKEPREYKLVPSIIRMLLSCRGIGLDDGAGESTYAGCGGPSSPQHMSVPPVLALRCGGVTAKVLAAIVDAAKRTIASPAPPAEAPQQQLQQGARGVVVLGAVDDDPETSAAEHAALLQSCAMWGATTLRELSVIYDDPAVVKMLRACPRLTSLSLYFAKFVVAALEGTHRLSAPPEVGAALAHPSPPSFGAALHTLQLMTGPYNDAALDTLVGGLPQLRALVLIGDTMDTDDTDISVAAWRRNLLVLLGRLEVLELRSAGENAFDAFNSLSRPEREPTASAGDMLSLCDLPTLPLRCLGLASRYGVRGDAAPFLRAVGQHPTSRMAPPGAAGLTELRLGEVTEETRLAAPPSVEHLRLHDPDWHLTDMAPAFDFTRLPHLKSLVLITCDDLFPSHLLQREGPTESLPHSSPLLKVAHPTLRTLQLMYTEGKLTRAEAREAWVVAMLGPSSPSKVRFPRLRHVMMNGVAVGGWPTHDPFV